MVAAEVPRPLQWQRPRPISVWSAMPIRRPSRPQGERLLICGPMSLLHCLLGLTLNTATGVISGTPTATTANAFTVTFRVTDCTGNTRDWSGHACLHPRTDSTFGRLRGSFGGLATVTEPSINRTGGRFVGFASTANLKLGVTRKSDVCSRPAN